MIYSHQHGDDVHVSEPAADEVHITIGVGAQFDEVHGVTEHKAHILTMRGDDQQLLVMNPDSWATHIVEMMDVAERLGGPYRDALIAAMRYRRSRFN